MNIKFSPNIKPLYALRNSRLAMLVSVSGVFAANSLSEAKVSDSFFSSPQPTGIFAAFGLSGIAPVVKRLKDSDNNFEISEVPIKELSEEEYQNFRAEVEKKKTNLNENNQNILKHIPLNDYNIQCLVKIIDSNELFYKFYNSLYFNNINSAKFFDYMFQRKGEISEKLGEDFLYAGIHNTIDSQNDLELKLKLLNYGLENPELGRNAKFAEILRNARSEEDAHSTFAHIRKYGVLPKKRQDFNIRFGEKIATKILEEIAFVKEKFNVNFDYLEMYSNFYNEPYLIFRGSGERCEDTLFKFDADTGELISFESNNTLYNMKKQTATILTPQKVKKKNGSFLGVDKLLGATLETFSMRDGGFINKSGFSESKIGGEFENYEITEDGRVYKNGLIEIDNRKGEHIEKHLISPDGTVTDYVFANDEEGNRYFYYKITDENKKILYETTKKFRVLSENHFQSVTDDIEYDIVFEKDKIRVKKLDENNRTVEYRIKKFDDEDYENLSDVIKQCCNDSDINKSLLEGDISLGEIAHDKKLIDKYIVDERIIDALKDLSGEEWFAIKRADVYALISDNDNDTAQSLGKCVQVGKDYFLLSVLEHEIGHEKANALNLEDDDDLKKIYEYERMLFVANVPGFAVEQAGYFLKDITSKGILETAAEANLIINAPVKWKNLGTRTIFLQQYFPKTIAYIANKYRTLG